MVVAATQIRLLLVDDEPMLLRSLARMLRFHPELAITTAGGGAEALERMGQQEFDAVVSDVQMPGVDGYELLREVRRRHPQTIRVISSSTVCTPEGLHLVHQYWVKPWSAAALVDGLLRTARVASVVQDRRWRAEAADVESLPAAPAVVLRLSQALADPDVSAATVAAVIETEPAVGAKILKLASSAFFGAQTATANITQAVVWLGTEIVRSLVITGALHDAVTPPADVLDINAHQAYSLLVAQLASQLVTDGEDRHTAFAAGLLSGVGQLVLAARMPQGLKEIERKRQHDNRPLAELEMETLGVTHGDLGAYLLGIWGLPEPIVDAVQHHHDNLRAQHRPLSPRDAVALATILADSSRGRGATGVSGPPADLARVVDDTRLAEWRALALRLVSSAGSVRRFPRAVVRWATQLREGATTVVGTVRDASTQGIFVEMDARLSPGTAVVVVIELPEGHKIQVPGVVRWCGRSATHGVAGAGIELAEPLQAITDYVRTHGGK
ncbi:MAG: HDOD domain-containing protein [Deltaproteobacteria bacterium]|nr:HDOD domain-containing protein [Deltaproteobacteria bacterium]